MLDRHYNTETTKSFFAPTRIYSGVDVRMELRRHLPSGPVILVVDERFVEDPAVVQLEPTLQFEVRREPRDEDLAAYHTSATALAPIAVVAFGGGSAIDTAKAIHAELCYGSFRIHDLERPRTAPVLIAVPTTAGSGSETSRFFVVADKAGVKQSYRSWSYAPDLAVLDPVVLRAAGPRRLALGAFDAFTHLWETYVCRNERDSVARMLALTGIPLIARALRGIDAGDTLSDEDLAGLQRASAFGGMCIANVRNGLIHTLGESLAQQVDLSHPETIYLFFEDALAQYQSSIAEDIALLDRHLALALGGDWDFMKLRATWRVLFARLGIEAHIEATLANRPVDLQLLEATVSRDQVLLKENPAPLTPGMIADLAATCLRGHASVRV